MILVKKEIENMDVSYFNRYMDSVPHLFKKQGEHYKLLNYISNKKNNIKIIDAGTCTGHSCLALAQNKTNTILTYDINEFNDTSIKSLSNVVFYKKDILEEDINVLLSSAIILLDIDPHDGKQEKIFTDKLLEIGYRGILICDDIFLNSAMKNWWDSISTKKLDLTEIGHFSGTGLVNYSDENIIIQ